MAAPDAASPDPHRPTYRPRLPGPPPTPIATPADVGEALAEYRRAGFGFDRAWRRTRDRVADADLLAALDSQPGVWRRGYEREAFAVRGAEALAALHLGSASSGA